LCQPAQAEWRRYIAALKVHEKGHVDINKQKTEDLMERFIGKTWNEIKEQIAKLNVNIKDAHDIYDIATDNGATQGAILCPTGYDPIGNTCKRGRLLCSQGN
jgi:hypothetical protein